MYWRYGVKTENRFRKFSAPERVSLFGCNTGEVVVRMRQEIPTGQEAPYCWHLDLDGVASQEHVAYLIDLKPSSKDSASLYQLRHVWGISDNDWTPVMFLLRGLVVDGPPVSPSREAFEIVPNPEHEGIVTFLYLNGSVAGGTTKGRWTPASPSPTNSALLWPDSLKWFMAELAKVEPEYLRRE